MPTVLDHILLGVSDLDRGVDFVELHTGMRAAFGGVHPGRGTQNALLSLGDRKYLEIIAPDPQQPANLSTNRTSHLQALTTPRLVGWAAQTADVRTLAEHLRNAGIAFTGPTPGSRKRPAGRLLEWQTLHLGNQESGLFPFFIEWSADSPHPACEAPKGCRLVRFELISPHPESLRKTLALLSVEATVSAGEKSQLAATLAGPHGQLALTS